MAIDVSRRWFCLGSVAAIAAVVAKPVPLLAAPAPSIVPMPTTSPYMLRRIRELTVNAGASLDRFGVTLNRPCFVGLRIAGKPVLQTGCHGGWVYRWFGDPMSELIVGESETIDFDVDTAMMEIEVGLVCRDTIAKNIAMDRSEWHRFGKGGHCFVSNDMYPEPFEIDNGGFRVKPLEFSAEELPEWPDE